jgi:rSAM/selenodomain-associated transferase 2
MFTGMRLSIIIPVLNEGDRLSDLLAHLASLCGCDSEVIVVDGGSGDDSRQAASHAGARVIRSERGRARQMNAGAAVAQGNIFLFLHADTMLPHSSKQVIEAAVRDSGGVSECIWGRFDVCIAGRPLILRVIATLMNWRSRISGIATGDQAMFVTRRAFESVGGFPEQPLMEDIELSRRLLTLSRPICLSDRVITSGRRWEAHGALKTVWLMWRLRWAYWRGADAAELAKLYR